MTRSDDTTQNNAFQSDRFFVVDGKWFFVTREDVTMGPFGSHKDAYEALTRYLDTQKIMGRLRANDPAVDDGAHWEDEAVAKAAREVADWRFQTSQSTSPKKSDKSAKTEEPE